jgi:hypothetical protein
VGSRVPSVPAAGTHDIVRCEVLAGSVGVSVDKAEVTAGMVGISVGEVEACGVVQV